MSEELLELRGPKSGIIHRCEECGKEVIGTPKMTGPAGWSVEVSEYCEHTRRLNTRTRLVGHESGATWVEFKPIS